MPMPIALCLERLDVEAGTTLVRCTARSGREDGLALSADGEILWCSAAQATCELWVSADDKLMAYRREGTLTIHLERAGRVFPLPEARAVVVLHGDVLRVADRRFRVHVHGATEVVEPPRRLQGALAVAAALAVGAAALGCAADTGVEVPEGRGLRAPATPIPLVLDVDGAGPADLQGAAGAGGAGGAPPLEVREFPPR